MRTAAFILVFFVAFCYAANAQKFSLLPHAGFENSKTKIQYNDLPSFAPAGVVTSAQFGLQLNYKIKSGHGIFLGAASSRSIVPFSFSDPETGMTNYTTTNGDMQLRFETGYQYNSKPLFFKKSGKGSANVTQNKTTERKSCCYAYRSHCMKNSSTASRSATTEKTKQQPQKSNSSGWVRLQPSAAFAFIPGTPSDVITKSVNGQPAYEYRAGNWSTAVMTGMAFEFGKNKTSLFTVGVNYFKGIGNLNTQTISTVTASKTLTTQLSSEVSGWNMRIGIPFTLGAKKTATHKQTENKTYQQKRSCSQYRTIYRCNKTF
jgi:hypothetical protein